jgi:uracil-DNA glycosylase family 4
VAAARITAVLEWAAVAYGQDLQLPRGTARARSAAAASPSPAPRADEPAAAPPPAAGPTAAASPFAGDGVLPVAPAGTTAAAAAGPAAPCGAAADLAALRSEVLACTRCKLHTTRHLAVFGEGSPTARVMFVGEAPGATEDRTGRPFVGEAGMLLDRILTGAMGLPRSAVYIANVNKCRPPGNREPQPDEVAACLPYLRQQVALVRPEVIVCLGRVAAQNLLGTHDSASKLRGRTLDYEGIPVVVTWHPAYLLREPQRKRETWEDIKRVNRLLGLPEVPPAAAH